MAMKVSPTPTATRALQRLTITRPPPVRPAANRVGVDAVEKRRTAVGLLSGHPGTVRARAAFRKLAGPDPVLEAEPGAVRRPRTTGTLAPESAVAEWVRARGAVTGQGPRGTNYLSELGVQRNLDTLDQKFRDQVEGLIAEARAGLDARQAALPRVPLLGSDLPPPDRAEQLRNVRERVRHDLAQFRDYVQKSIDTNDRALGDELVSLGRANTTEGGPWAAAPMYGVVMGSDFGQGPPGLIEELQEFFLTPTGAAGEVNGMLTALQQQELVALAVALDDPAVTETLPTLLYNRAYPWLQGPPPGTDAADVYAELVRLATPPATEPNQLDATGTRIVAIDAEKLGMRQFAGDRGSRAT